MIGFIESPPDRHYKQTNKQTRNNKTNRTNDMEIAEHVASYTQ